MPTPPKLPTQFAPAERAAPKVITQQAHFVSKQNLLDPLLNAIQEGVVVLNQERQIVYANAHFRQTFGNGNIADLLGQRTGEVMSCEHASETEGGCGTTESCRQCGAILTVLEAQSGRKTSQECQISVRDGNEVKALDLQITSTPFTFDNQQFIVLAAADISNEKRRSILERIFFHDLTNTASVIYGLVELLGGAQDLNELSSLGLSDLLAQASTRLLDEIEAQQQIMAAERGELVVVHEPLETWRFLNKQVTMYRNNMVAEGKKLVLDPQIANLTIESDEALLGRVVGNMIKNALEASGPGETVTVGGEQIYDYVRFWVHNSKHMPRKIQLQLFKRSFSTKGHGRGLGTYSMKMLSENYLQGRVSFTTDEKSGTTFMAMYPRKWPLALPLAEQKT